MKPIIGITGNLNEEEGLVFLKQHYVRSVARAGGAALILPPTLDEDMVDLYISVCGGLLFSGGGDIDPIYWGEMATVESGEINPLRDNFEITLARQALALRIPALGICRGCQVMNVAGGGRLIQDIPTDISHIQNAPRHYPFHDIFIEKNTCLAAITRCESIRVNSFHHQAVLQPGEDMWITACAPDGIAEAVEAYKHPFFLGVQWHPECLRDEVSSRLFQALVEASRLRNENLVDMVQEKHG